MLVGTIFTVSFFGVLIGYGQAKAGKRWGEILYYVSILPLGLTVGYIVGGMTT